ncbi:MAG TPA: hypothetical protein PKB15_06085 [Acidimicrobiia bacterium]|nr:hypothetical protein [Acidimicrobiia bacterium]
MHGFADIPKARMRVGGSNGIDVLAERVRRENMSAYTVPDRLVSETTGKTPAEWAELIDGQEELAPEELGELGELVFPGRKLEAAETVRVIKKRGLYLFHTDAGGVDLSLHMGGNVVDAETRNVYVAHSSESVRIEVPNGLSSRVILETLGKAVRPSYVSVGVTGPGTATVFSAKSTAHLFYGGGQYVRF